MMAGTLVRPDKSVHRPRETTSAIYELVVIPHTKGHGSEQPVLVLPDTGVQIVDRLAPDKARVSIRIGGPDLGGLDSLPDQMYLDPSTVLGANDPVIRALVDQAMSSEGDGTDEPRKAEALRQFVNGYIHEKGLVGRVRGPPVRVARTAHGDCTEHAVLLAAMLRAAGIPSRTVSGLIYADQFMERKGVFAYHMWTQAWIPNAGGADGRWVDLDATLDEKAFDATHIALSTSAMADGSVVNDMVKMVPLIGRLQIHVISVNGKRLAEDRR